jgi:hypothetical protein
MDFYQRKQTVLLAYAIMSFPMERRGDWPRPDGKLLYRPCLTKILHVDKIHVGEVLIVPGH